MLKNYSPKQLLLAAITAVIALFNFFTPIFHVVGVTVSGFGFSNTWAFNGYQIPFGAADGFDLLVEGYVWYMICGWLHLLATVAVIALLVYVFLKRPADLQKASYLAILVTAGLSLLYLINGVIAAAIVEYSYTVAFVPFIIVAVLAAGYVVCEKLLPENLKK